MKIEVQNNLDIINNVYVSFSFIYLKSDNV